MKGICHQCHLVWIAYKTRLSGITNPFNYANSHNVDSISLFNTDYKLKLTLSLTYYIIRYI